MMLGKGNNGFHVDVMSYKYLLTRNVEKYSNQNCKNNSQTFIYKSLNCEKLVKQNFARVTFLKSAQNFTLDRTLKPYGHSNTNKLDLYLRPLG